MRGLRLWARAAWVEWAYRREVLAVVLLVLARARAKAVVRREVESWKLDVGSLRRESRPFWKALRRCRGRWRELWGWTSPMVLEIELLLYGLRSLRHGVLEKLLHGVWVICPLSWGGSQPNRGCLLETGKDQETSAVSPRDSRSRHSCNIPSHDACSADLLVYPAPPGETQKVALLFVS